MSKCRTCHNCGAAIESKAARLYRRRIQFALCVDCGWPNDSAEHVRCDKCRGKRAVKSQRARDRA
jgi:hypothetical protein